MLSHDDLVEILRLTYQEKKPQRYVGEMFGVGKSTIGDFLRKETYKEFWQSYEDKPVASGEIISPDKKRKILTGKKYVFTSAQNNTYVHDKFLKSILHYCEQENAELIIGTFQYNKNGFQNGKSEDTWFDPKIRDYILNESCEIEKDLLWCGELNILPTAVNPLSGLHNYTNKHSAIVPHAKMQLESLPTPKFEPAKMMYTTGCITQRNYIEMKSGQKASHHHVFGALVVEVDEDGDWFVRQLSAETETGSFFDLGWYYTPKGKEQEPYCVEAINWGDIHAAKIDPIVADISWGNRADSMINSLLPEHVFLHDVFDHKNRNHHNLKDPYFMFKMFVDGTESVKEEVALTTDIISDMVDKCPRVVVVESNHDLALERWLKEQDYRKDPVNALFFLEMQLENYLSMSEGEPLKTFEKACHLVDDRTKQAIFLTTDESYTICGDIECGQHGHTGNNGARGSIRAFQMQGGRFNTGHTHCLTADHSVHIKGKGWVDIDKVVKGDTVASYKDGKMVWTEVEETIAGSYTGKLLTIGGGRFSQTVTDNHHMYLKDGEYVPVMEAIVTKGVADVPISAEPMEDTEDYDISDADIMKIVAFCADGHYCRKEKTMRFHFKKDRKVKRCEDLFGEDLTGFKLQKYGSYKTSISKSSGSYKMLSQYLNGSKTLPEIFNNISIRQSKVFLEELILWDGTAQPTGNGRAFSTVKREEAMLVSSIINKLGYRCTTKLKKDSRVDQKDIWHISWCQEPKVFSKETNYSCDKERINSWKTLTKDVVDVPVYCISNELRNFWVRDHKTGKISLTGNSCSIKDGVYTAGVSGLMEMGYNRGGSSWSHSHIVTYSNGKRTIITIKNGKWKA